MLLFLIFMMSMCLQWDPFNNVLGLNSNGGAFSGRFCYQLSSSFDMRTICMVAQEWIIKRNRDFASPFNALNSLFQVFPLSIILSYTILSIWKDGNFIQFTAPDWMYAVWIMETRYMMVWRKNNQILPCPSVIFSWLFFLSFFQLIEDCKRFPHSIELSLAKLVVKPLENVSN